MEGRRQVMFCYGSYEVLYSGGVVQGESSRGDVKRPWVFANHGQRGVISKTPVDEEVVMAPETA